MEETPNTIHKKYHTLGITLSIFTAIFGVILFNYFSKDTGNNGELNSSQTGSVDTNISLGNLYPQDMTQIFASGSIFTKNWKDNICNPKKINIEYINQSDHILPASLLSDTIYILNTGEYIFDYYINISKCSALIGDSKTTFYTKEPESFMIRADKDDNFIISGIHIDGEKDGKGGTHEQNGVGIFLNSSSNNSITNTTIKSNVAYGIYLGAKSKNNTLSNIETSNNNEGIHLNNANENILENIYTFNNLSDGIYLWANSDLNIMKNIFSYNNIRNGFFTKNSHNNIFNNILSFNNGVNGFHILSKSWFNSFNNILAFSNNETGLFFDDSDQNVLNNIYSFSNLVDGFSLKRNSYITYNNISAFDNGVKGLRFWNGGVSNKYFGKIKVFLNGENISGKGTFLTGKNSDIFEDGKIYDSVLGDLLKFKGMKADSKENSWKIFSKGKQETGSGSIHKEYNFDNISKKQEAVYYYDNKKLAPYLGIKREENTYIGDF